MDNVTDVLAQADAVIGRALSRLATSGGMETKGVIRHVRDTGYWKEAAGTVIIAKNIQKLLKNVVGVEDHPNLDDTVVLLDSKKRKYDFYEYEGKWFVSTHQPNPGKWGTDLASGKTDREAILAFDKKLGELNPAKKVRTTPKPESVSKPVPVPVPIPVQAPTVTAASSGPFKLGKTKPADMFYSDIADELELLSQQKETAPRIARRNLLAKEKAKREGAKAEPYGKKPKPPGQMTPEQLQDAWDTANHSAMHAQGIQSIKAKDALARKYERTAKRRGIPLVATSQYGGTGMTAAQAATLQQARSLQQAKAPVFDRWSAADIQSRLDVVNAVFTDAQTGKSSPLNKQDHELLSKYASRLEAAYVSKGGAVIPPPAVMVAPPPQQALSVRERAHARKLLTYRRMNKPVASMRDDTLETHLAEVNGTLADLQAGKITLTDTERVRLSTRIATVTQEIKDRQKNIIAGDLVENAKPKDPRPKLTANDRKKVKGLRERAKAIESHRSKRGIDVPFTDQEKVEMDSLFAEMDALKEKYGISPSNRNITRLAPKNLATDELIRERLRVEIELANATQLRERDVLTRRLNAIKASFFTRHIALNQ